MMVPTIHMNGTSKESLLDDACNVMNAIYKAIDVACAAAPNARDYYTQGNEAYSKARDEHDARIERLEAVRKEYEALALAISDFE